MSAFSGKLIHTVTVQVRTSTSSVDDYEGATWATATDGADVPCLWQPRLVTEFNNRTLSSISLRIQSVFMEFRTITEQNRLINLKERSGTVLQAGPFDIEAALDMGGQQRFLELRVKRTT